MSGANFYFLGAVVASDICMCPGEPSKPLECSHLAWKLPQLRNLKDLRAPKWFFLSETTLQQGQPHSGASERPVRHSMGRSRITNRSLMFDPARTDGRS